MLGFHCVVFYRKLYRYIYLDKILWFPYPVWNDTAHTQAHPISNNEILI